MCAATKAPIVHPCLHHAAPRALQTPSGPACDPRLGQGTPAASSMVAAAALALCSLSSSLGHSAQQQQPAHPSGRPAGLARSWQHRRSLPSARTVAMVASQDREVAGGGAPATRAAAAAEADLSSALSLANIRQTLIRLEDTIIFSLIERAQFARNDAVYQPGAIEVPGFMADGRRYSLLEYLLREIEQVRGWARGWGCTREGWAEMCMQLSSAAKGGGQAHGRRARCTAAAAAPCAASATSTLCAGARPHPAVHEPGREPFLPRGRACPGAAAHHL